MAPAARREQLLDAALAVVVRDGHRAVSIDAIAREAGVTRPVVYNVFPDLRALLLALLDRQEQRALGQLLGRLPAADRFSIIDIEPLIRALIDMVRSDPDTWHPVLATFVDAPPAVRARIDRDRDLVRASFRALLEQAPLRPELDTDVLAHALVAVAEYFGRLLLTDPDAVTADRLATTVGATIGALVGPP